MFKMSCVSFRCYCILLSSIVYYIIYVGMKLIICMEWIEMSFLIFSDKLLEQDPGYSPWVNIHTFHKAPNST